MDKHDAESAPKAEQERRWLEANRPALAAYNLRVAKHGLLSDRAGLLCRPFIGSTPIGITADPSDDPATGQSATICKD